MLAGLLFSNLALFAQQDSTYILDTIQYNNKNIVLFSDNVWSYTSTLEELANDKAFTDTAKIFTEYWNRITFAYMYPDPGPAPDSVMIILTDSNRHFQLPHYGIITSGFGWRNGRAHKAIDIGLDRGEPVYAAFDGKVRYAEFNTGGYGNLVIIRHFNGLETYYAHLNKIYVKPDQIIKAGQVIGGGGNTGAPWAGPHLHFETRWYDHAFDPLKIINFDSLCLKSDTVILRPSDFVISQNHKSYVNNGVNNDGSTAKVNYGGSENTTPVQTSPASSGKTIGNFYYVKSGDTLSGIAARFGTSVTKLCEMNGISKNSILRIGQKIKIR
jgi:murein DD-endopeptidase MepM/ murein hydrolase activator NlpD